MAQKPVSKLSKGELATRKKAAEAAKKAREEGKPAPKPVRSPSEVGVRAGAPGSTGGVRRKQGQTKGTAVGAKRKDQRITVDGKKVTGLTDKPPFGTTVSATREQPQGKPEKQRMRGPGSVRSVNTAINEAKEAEAQQTPAKLISAATEKSWHARNDLLTPPETQILPGYDTKKGNVKRPQTSPPSAEQNKLAQHGRGFIDNASGGNRARVNQREAHRNEQHRLLDSGVRPIVGMDIACSTPGCRRTHEVTRNTVNNPVRSCTQAGAACTNSISFTRKPQSTTMQGETGTEV